MRRVNVTPSLHPTVHLLLDPGTKGQPATRIPARPRRRGHHAAAPTPTRGPLAPRGRSAAEARVRSLYKSGDFTAAPGSPYRPRKESSNA
jgi:hypothetical protein